MARPTSPLISRERAARAALGVIDVRGLDSLSLEAVARRLGVKAPSLYYHFSDKNALLAEVARLLLLDTPVPPSNPDEDDHEWIVRIAVAARRSILQHPNAAPLLLQFFPRRLLLAAYERSLDRYGIPAEQHMMAVEGLDHLTFGSALFAAASRARGIEPMPEFDPEQFPKLALAVRRNPHDDEALFIETVRAFLRGLPKSSAQQEPPNRETRKKRPDPQNQAGAKIE